MKTIIHTMFLVLAVVLSANSQILTNGVYVENGKTFEVVDSSHKTTSDTNSEMLHFSNELIVKLYTNSDFIIDNFSQEILNTNNTPEKVVFGSHNFSSTLVNGTIIIIYAGGDSNSSCVLSTSMTDFELSKGTFYIKVDENKVLAVVLNGSLKSSNKSREIVVTAGHSIVAIPNGIGILEDKISFYVGETTLSETTELNMESKDVTKLKDTIMFALIDGKIVGIVIH